MNANCHGEVTAIEYCYQYSVSGEGDAVFNWTVLILEESGDSFMITNVYVIQNHPRLVSSENCTNVGGGQVTCCDATHISGFVLPMNFVFGVTEADQGNTHGATLLGFFDGFSQYMVDTTQLSKAGLSLSVGTTVLRVPVIQRGLRMLWFIIGKYCILCAVYLSHILYQRS